MGVDFAVGSVMRNLRDRILCKIWPDLWYKLNTTFTEEEIHWVECQLDNYHDWNSNWRIGNSLRLKTNPLRQKFYNKEYADKIKKEWGLK